MKIIKIAAVIAASFLITLFIVIIKVENPEIALYQETVEMLMLQEGVNTKQEIEEHFPILTEIQANLDKIAKLNQFIACKTQSPAPVLTEVEAIQLEDHIKWRGQLRKKVRVELDLLIVTYAENQP